MAAMSDYYEDELAIGTFRTNILAVWAATTAYSLGDRVVALAAGNARIFEATTAGTSGASEPSWNTALGATTVDATVTWTTYMLSITKRPIYVALYTSATTDAGGGTEVTGGAYARVQFDPLDANWNAPSGGNGLVDNALDITFPVPTANWGTVSHVALYDALTGGNSLIHGALTTSKTVNNGDPAPKFSAGDLDITFA